MINAGFLAGKGEKWNGENQAKMVKLSLGA